MVTFLEQLFAYPVEGSLKFLFSVFFLKKSIAAILTYAGQIVAIAASASCLFLLEHSFWSFVIAFLKHTILSAL